MRAEGWAGYAGNALSDQPSEVEATRQGLRFGDRWPFFRRHIGLVDWPYFRQWWLIGLVEDGDKILISIPERSIKLDVADDVLAERRTAMDKKGWKPAEKRERAVSKALKAYAAFATSADRGAVRELD